jgi:hypothetical protein
MPREGHGEFGLSLTVVYFYSSPSGPQCSLWLFFASSVLNSEKRNAGLLQETGT